VALERNRDWGGALAKLDEAKKLQPEQPFLWSNYGYLAMVQSRAAEAKADYQHELAHHPDESFVVNLYGQFLVRQGEKEDALRVAKSYFERDAADPTVARLLASIQGSSNVGDAIATLRRAHEANPEDRSLQHSLANYLVRDHQEGEAAEIALKLLKTANDDPDSINDGAYLLAEANGDLALAEQKSRESLHILDAQTSQTTISEANRQNFTRSSLLVASWDTLGYILEKEKKLDEAGNYLEAAWNNRLGSAPVGLHYGELLEVLGKQQDALRIYELAWHRPRQSAPDPIEQAIRAGISRMTAAGMNSTVGQNGQSILQDQRTFKLKLASANKSYWSTTYRLQFSAGRAPDILLVEGKAEKEGIENSIKKLDLPHLVPSSSTGSILRDGVLSCSPGQAECTFVLMPMGSIEAEHPHD
jgi:Tfp pilus assembly protein PilF